MKDKRLLIVGASARAAVFSAARAGFEPFWIDQFGDYDLCERYQGIVIKNSDYPAGIIDKLDELPDIPFVYTGAMENHPDIINKISSKRKLLGNNALVCQSVRNPQNFQNCLAKYRIKTPALLAGNHNRQDAPSWLSKPIKTAGGQHIDYFSEEIPFDCTQQFLQEYIEGESLSAIYLANGKLCELVGVTWQLVGEKIFQAKPFSYCGSIGPLALNDDEYNQWNNIGSALTQDFGLLGLFGVDAIKKDETIIPVEINPRYTASVEVLEQAMGRSLMGLHCHAAEGRLDSFIMGNYEIFGKAYLFAANDIKMPDSIISLKNHDRFFQMADIPFPGSNILAGAPIMTILTQAGDIDACYSQLKNLAENIYNETGAAS